MDDLRPFSFKTQKDIPVYTNEATKNSLENKFPYIFQKEVIFKDRPILGGGIPRLRLCEVENETSIESHFFHFFSLPHGYGKTLGIVHSKLAYIVDCHEIPDETVEFLTHKKLDLLIIDCLREQSHQTHLTFEKSLQYIAKINPKIAVLTHLGHELEYQNLQRKLVKCKLNNVLIGLDGMSFLYS